MYTADIFEADRCIHMGIDLGGPVDTPLKAFFDGTYYKMGINPDKGDYGEVMVTRHLLGRRTYTRFGVTSHTPQSKVKMKVMLLSKAILLPLLATKMKTAIGHLICTFSFQFMPHKPTTCPAWSHLLNCRQRLLITPIQGWF